MVVVELVIILLINLSFLMMRKFYSFINALSIICLLVAFPASNLAQEFKILTKGVNSSLRGHGLLLKDMSNATSAIFMLLIAVQLLSLP